MSFSSKLPVDISKIIASVPAPDNLWIASFGMVMVYLSAGFLFCHYLDPILHYFQKLISFVAVLRAEALVAIRL